MVLSGTMPSQIYNMLEWDFYYVFQLKVKSTHHHFMKQAYGFDDETIFSSGEMNESFAPVKFCSSVIDE
jgi:hypothetical protein